MSNEDICEAITNSQTMAAIELARAVHAVKQAAMHMADLGCDTEMMNGVAEYLAQQCAHVGQFKIDTLLF